MTSQSRSNMKQAASGLMLCNVFV